MTAPTGKWEDLAPRTLSGVALAAVCLALIWAGGPFMLALAALAAGVMIWELARLGAPERPREAVALGLIAALCLAVPVMLRGNPLLFALLAAPAAALALTVRGDRWVAALYALALMAAAYGFVAFREGLGLAFVIWLILVVAASDLAGYFGGRALGGPKFWPRISPKKTWSGTVAGWLGAAVVGGAFVLWAGAPVWVVALSVATAFAAQLGDIAESAVKRRAGVKDSSAILPGHGGLLDRFDGMAGAAVFLLLWGFVLPWPDLAP